MYLHQGKNFLILTEAISLDTYQKLKEDLTLSTYAYHLLELVDKLTAENQEDRVSYEYLVEVLKRLERKPRQILIRAFEVKILSNLGFATFQNPQVSIQSYLGGRILRDLEVMPWSEIEKMKINQKEAMELERILRYHLEKVIEGSLKSRKFLKDVKNE